MPTISYRSVTSRAKRVERRVRFQQTARLVNRLKKANQRARRERGTERALEERFLRIAESLTAWIQAAQPTWPGAVLAAFEGELSVIWGLEHGLPLELFSSPVSTLQGGKGARARVPDSEGEEKDGPLGVVEYEREEPHASEIHDSVDL